MTSHPDIPARQGRHSRALAEIQAAARRVGDRTDALVVTMAARAEERHHLIAKQRPNRKLQTASDLLNQVRAELNLQHIRL